MLVVDRDPNALGESAAALRKTGLSVDCAQGAVQARRLLMERPYSVIVLDRNVLGEGDTSPLDLALEADLPAMFVVTCDRAERSSLNLPRHVGEQAMKESNLAGVVAKPWIGNELLDLVKRAAVVAQRRARVRAGQKVDEFVGQVLLLDDDQEASARMLDQLGHVGIPRQRVAHMTHLESALEAPDLTNFAAALVDLQLHDAVGLDAIRALGAAAPDLPLVVLAGPDTAIAEQALLLGAQEVLEPGADDRVLLTTLRRARLRKQSDKKMRYRGSHDGLTGLFNAAQFREQLTQCVTRVRRDSTACAVLYLDLDGFKPVNDHFGHAAGDQVLRAVAARLEDAIRDCDRAARLGGDEFAVLLEDVYDQKAVRVVAQRILRTISAPIAVDKGAEVRVTASVGIAMCPQVSQQPEALIEAADEAMLVAKQAGRSQYCFAQGADAAPPTAPRGRLMAEVREAAMQNQFYVVYQPQLNLRTRQINGMEALLRWQRPDGSRVGPDEFIPVLEQLDLIGGVGAFVLKEACRHVRSLWDRKGQHLRVAVNVAPQQLEDPEFPALVQSVLEEFDLAPSSLELEVTEGTLMREGSGVRESLRRVRAMGVRVALDDFGTGYAALSYLREFPLDAIKIDRSFISPLETDNRSRILVGAIIDLARQLGMEVLAEGVETPHQLAYLRERGCDSCQGYLFGRPHFSGHFTQPIH